MERVQIFMITQFLVSHVKFLLALNFSVLTASFLVATLHAEAIEKQFSVMLWPI